MVLDRPTVFAPSTRSMVRILEVNPKWTFFPLREAGGFLSVGGWLVTPTDCIRSKFNMTRPVSPRTRLESREEV